MLNRNDLLRTLAEKIATDFFLSMLNPAYRGKKFRFSAFNIENWVQGHLGINFPHTRRPTASELTSVGKIARVTWEQLITQVGDGIPKKTR